jgi:hypothetical protein
MFCFEFHSFRVTGLPSEKPGIPWLSFADTAIEAV